MSISVRSIEEHELPEFMRVLITAFGAVATPVDIEQSLSRTGKRAEIDRFIAAFDSERLVGTSLSFVTSITLPGLCDADVAWVLCVTTLPSHRRRGVMRDVMTEQLHRLHGEGVVFAGLAADVAVYRRFGFGVAAAHLDVTFGSRRELLMPSEWDGTVDFTDEIDVTEMSRLHETWCRSKVGEIACDAAWWESPGRQGRGHVVLRNSSGEVEAWAAYRPGDVWEVDDFVAVNPQARRALWNVVLGFDAAESIRVRFVPLDDPILAVLDDPMGVKVELSEGPWLRVLDVAAAIAQRRFVASISRVIRVHDPILQHNNGSFCLASGEATNKAADVELHVADFASAFTGHRSFRQLNDAGLCCATNEVIAELDEAFAVAPSPHCSLRVV
jgi:predicted acetyltransferase